MIDSLRAGGIERRRYSNGMAIFIEGNRRECVVHRGGLSAEGRRGSGSDESVIVCDS